MDFTERRGIVFANTARIDGGIALEEIPHAGSHYAPAMVLVKSNWSTHYFLIKREGWSDDQYFEHAEQLMYKLGITNP